MRPSELGWTVLHDERAQVRELGGRQVRVQIEDGGFRLYIDGERRGFFDRSSHARAHAFWLNEHGWPKWEPEPVSVTGRTHEPHHRGGS